MKRQQGMALLLVLWTLALLAILLGALVVEVRQQARLALWQREHTRASLAAEAGMNLAVRMVSDPALNRRWVADGSVRTLTFDDARLQVSIRSERGKLDLNAAPAADFARLLTLLGASPVQARSLADNLQQRRSDGQPPLRALEELRDLATMSAALYLAVRAHVTVWSGLESPEPAFATPVLQRALDLPRLPPLGADAGQALEIRVQAWLPDGFTAALDCTVVLLSMDGVLPMDSGVRPFRVVRYNE